MAKFQLLAAVLSLLAINTSVFATKINVRNGCSYTVTACDQGPGSSSNVTCYALQGGYSRERDVGASWNGGMIWGFPGDDAITALGLTAWNQANYALFCINLRGVDYYDLSNVNAYNLPLMILSNNSACGTINCTISEKLKSFCQAPNVLSGAPGYGCLNTDGNGDYSTNGTRKFKDACPYADSYSTEDQGLARNCTTGSNYELVFCPASNDQTYNSLSNESYIISPSTSPVSQSSPTSNQTDTSHRSTASIARNVGDSISGGVVFVLISFLVCVFIVRRRRRLNLLEDEDEDCAFLESLPGLPPRFSYDDLDLATNHFSRIVGEGGFGTVYEGALPDGSEVAVKRLGASKHARSEGVQS